MKSLLTMNLGVVPLTFESCLISKSGLIILGLTMCVKVNIHKFMSYSVETEFTYAGGWR